MTKRKNTNSGCHAQPWPDENQAFFSIRLFFLLSNTFVGFSFFPHTIVASQWPSDSCFILLFSLSSHMKQFHFNSLDSNSNSANPSGTLLDKAKTSG